MLQIVNSSRGVVIADRVGVAKTSEERRVGLLRRRGISRGEGLWLVPCARIHTVGMNFPIDVVFIDCRGIVLQLEKRLPDGFEIGCAGAYSALELAPGRSDDTGLEVGDKLVFRRS